LAGKYVLAESDSFGGILLYGERYVREKAVAGARG